MGVAELGGQVAGIAEAGDHVDAGFALLRERRRGGQERPAGLQDLG